MVCGMLRQGGFDVLEAADGLAALQVVERSKRVDLVLTDMIMPAMGGLELAERLAKLMPKVPVVFMSGYVEDPIVRVLDANPAILLSKPFTAGALLNTVREVLSQPWPGLPGLAEE